MKNSDDSGYTGNHVGVCVLDTGIFPHMFFISIVFVLLSFFYIQHTLKRDRKLFTIPNEYEALKSSQRMQIQ